MNLIPKPTTTKSNKYITDKQTAQSRYNVCKSCERFNTVTYTCKECGCLMKLKVKFITSQCPIGKW